MTSMPICECNLNLNLEGENQKKQKQLPPTKRGYGSKPKVLLGSVTF